MLRRPAICRKYPVEMNETGGSCPIIIGQFVIETTDVGGYRTRRMMDPASTNPMATLNTLADFSVRSTR